MLMAAPEESQDLMQTIPCRCVTQGLENDEWREYHVAIMSYNVLLGAGIAVTSDNQACGQGRIL